MPWNFQVMNWGAFRGWYRNLVQQNFPKIYKGNPNEAAKKEEVPTAICCHQATGLHPIELFDKVVPWKYPNNLQTIIKTPLLKITTTQFIEYGEVELVSTQTFTYMFQCLCWGRYSATYQKKKRYVFNNPDTKTQLYNADLPAKYAWVMVTQSLWK